MNHAAVTQPLRRRGRPRRRRSIDDHVLRAELVDGRARQVELRLPGAQRSQLITGDGRVNERV